MDQIQYIGKQIRRYRKDRGWSAGQLGQMVEPKKTESAVTSWERGRTQPDGDILIQLCRIFQVDIADFYYNPPEFEEKMAAWVEVPYYGAIAAGEPIEMIDRNETYLVPAQIVEAHPNSGVLQICGNSWNKGGIYDGFFVFVDFDIREPANEHEPFAVRINGDHATVKSIQKLENGLRLLPNSYDETIKPITFDYSKDGDMSVDTLGKVVWTFAPFDYGF